MLNRYNRNTMDPKQINSYNKFLTTLDTKSNQKNHDNVFPEKNKNLRSDSDIKNELDKIIDKIHKSFNTNEYTSSNFNGQTLNDMCYANDSDPNYYRDINNHKVIYLIRPSTQHLTPSKSKKESEKTIEIRDTINIEAQVDNINDILKLVDKYPNDPTIKYNINIKALHDIKIPLEELNNMIGMKDLKNNIVDQILYFIQELHKGKLSSGDFMHTVIYGPPGTGKTEIAKIMGKIYSKIGILNKGTFKKVTRSDLIAGYLGQTALKTKEVIKEALGGVLFIDEAYALGNSEKRDSFAKECIDTLCEALSDHKENLMVIVAGYENELKECFFDYNQGLDSRFTWRFKTDEYDYKDLHQIFLKKVKEINWSLDEKSEITPEWFKKNIDYFKFYGRDIETILAKTKIAHSKRVFCKSENEKRKIILKDLENGFQMYLKNENVKNRKSDLDNKKYLYNTLYS